MKKCTVAHTCTQEEVSTFSNLITLILCGDQKHCTTECIIQGEVTCFVIYSYSTFGSFNYDKYGLKDKSTTTQKLQLV